MPTVPRPPRVTAAMVAERARTSIATVSLVVNDKHRGRVSDEVAARVRQAVADLGYVVDHAASSLARGRSDLVVLVAPDLSNPFFGAVVAGVRDVLSPAYRLLLSVTDRGAQPSAADVRPFAALRPAGLLVDAPEDRFLDDLGAHAEPLVLLDAPGLEPHAAAVNYDLAPGVAALVAHLRDVGHARVAYLDGATGASTFALRRRLFDAGAAEAGMQVVGSARADVAVDSAAAVAAASLPAWRAAGATAVVAAADTLAYGVLAAATSLGLRTPEDLAVTGFDDLPSSRVLGLTSVALPADALGRAAAARLVDLIDGAGPASTRPAVLEARLVVRTSSGVVRTGA